MTAQRGILGFGPQAAMESVATAFYRHKASDVDLGVLDDVRLGPPEVGGKATPTFPYKAGVAVGGGGTLFPRLEDTFGWLLYGAQGAVNTITGDGIGDNPPTGVNRHEFIHAAEDTFLPWMTFKKLIPGSDSSNDLGEIYKDCKIVGLTFNVSSEDPISARVDVLGRVFEEADPSGWSWENSYETFESIPVGAKVGGYMKIPGFSSDELPIVGATISLQNAPLEMAQEKVYGSPYLEDVTIVGRAVTFDVLVKWKNPDLYRSIVTGATDGAQWTATPWAQDFDLVAESPENIAGQTVPYKLRVEADKVLWQVNGGIRLAANQNVMMRLTGNAIEPDSGGDFLKLSLDNEVAAYTWPTP